MKKISRKEFLKCSAGGFLGLWVRGFSQNQKNHCDQAPGRQHGYPNPSSAGGVKKKWDRFNDLGKTGLKVSALGFGVSRTMEPALVLAAIDAGINFMDTGRSYFRGQNEAMLGKVVAPRRQGIIIQSKLRVNLSKNGLHSAEDVSRALKEIENSLVASLKSLRTDYVDIMLIHGAEEPEVIHQEEIMAFFDKEKKVGRIRAHGFSTHHNQVELIKAENRARFYDVIMTTYNHKGAYVHMNTGRKVSWDHETLEQEMIEARDRGAGLVAMKTCSGGPYSPSPGLKPTFEGALRWILERGVVHTMAVAMVSDEEIRENLRAWGETTRQSF